VCEPKTFHNTNRTMRYMKLLPIVTELNLLWRDYDSAANEAARTVTGAKINTLLAQLPPKEAVAYPAYLESAAELSADRVPLLRRIKALSKEEATLLETQAQLQKMATVKWGPKRTESGETLTSVERKLTPIVDELKGLREKDKAILEQLEPDLSFLKRADVSLEEDEELAVWNARGLRGTPPACVTELLRLEEEAFRAVAEIVR
jgi:hypothetical protein